MQFSKSLVLAVLAMAYASPMVARSEISPQVSKNCAEVDQAVIQLVMNMSKLTSKYVSNFVSSLTHSVESTVASIENMVVDNNSQGIVKASLTPFINSVARGSAFLVESLAQSPGHLITHDTVNELVHSLEKVSSVASAHNVPTNQLTSAISKLNNVNGHLAARSEISPQISKNCAEVDQAVIQLVMNLTHLTSKYVANFVSSLTHSIESTISNVASLSTDGRTNGLVKASLAPFVTSVARGSAFFVESLAQSPDHLVSHDTVNQLVQSLEKVSTVAAANDVSTVELKSAISKLNGVSSHLESRAAFNPIYDAIKGGAQNAEQTIQALVHQLKSNDGHPTADMLSAGITGLDSQIDNLVNMVSTALGPLTFGLSDMVGDALLGPVFQSITNGAEVLIANIAGGAVDLVTQPAIQLFTHTLNRAIALGTKNHVKATSKLQSAVARLDALTKANAKASTKANKA
ncbi:hypothetical protein B9G98_02754 [Wickerhamiella sorbophila]|uniref:Cell wall mannoprotein 1 n=1 Tax=Wickerhamiella sorbophila TaxID=45607 RepID=A0A2T0FJF0_9ASCO|nr:hypothetical protein B9G98_02754 [Wickerhamiella sorbophila]PRT55134.1 hypothetical protein B9G98_02754 [Wickerhamiella sorbophila]